MRKNKVITYTRQWAIGIVSFARSKDETRYYNLAGFNLEPDDTLEADGVRRRGRIVATDGHRLAWQGYPPFPPDGKRGLIDEHFNPLEGEFPDYKCCLPGKPKIAFYVCRGNQDWLPALKTIARIIERPFGTLECDGEHVSVKLESHSPTMKVSLAIPINGGNPKPFKIGINLWFLFEAINAAVKSNGVGTWFVRVSIVDELTAIAIDNDATSFYSITMPCRADGAFCWKPELEKAEAA